MRVSLGSTTEISCSETSSPLTVKNSVVWGANMSHMPSNVQLLLSVSSYPKPFDRNLDVSQFLQLNKQQIVQDYLKPPIWRCLCMNFPYLGSPVPVLLIQTCPNALIPISSLECLPPPSRVLLLPMFVLPFSTHSLLYFCWLRACSPDSFQFCY